MSICCDCQEVTTDDFRQVCAETQDFWRACKITRAGRTCGSCAPKLWGIYHKEANDEKDTTGKER